MTRGRRLLWSVAAVAVAIAAATMAARLFVPRWVHDWIERAGSEALGRDLRIAGSFDLSLSLRPTLEAEEVTLANAPWGTEPAMIRVARIKIAVDLRSLWVPPVRIDDLEIEGVRIFLESDPEGRGNWELARKPPPASPPGDRPPVVFGHAAIRDLEFVQRLPRDAPRSGSACVGSKQGSTRRPG